MTRDKDGYRMSPINCVVAKREPVGDLQRLSPERRMSMLWRLIHNTATTHNKSSAECVDTATYL